MPAGELRERVTFQQRAVTSDGYGNSQGSWADEFTRSAKVQPRLGGETVLAARLSGTQPVLIIVRYDGETAEITPEWRAVNARDATKIYNIRSVANPDMRRRWIELLCEEGVAT